MREGREQGKQRLEKGSREVEGNWERNYANREAGRRREERRGEVGKGGSGRG